MDSPKSKSFSLDDLKKTPALSLTIIALILCVFPWIKETRIEPGHISSNSLSLFSGHINFSIRQAFFSEETILSSVPGAVYLLPLCLTALIVIRYAPKWRPFERKIIIATLILAGIIALAVHQAAFSMHYDSDFAPIKVRAYPTIWFYALLAATIAAAFFSGLFTKTDKPRPQDKDAHQ